MDDEALIDILAEVDDESFIDLLASLAENSSDEADENTTSFLDFGIANLMSLQGYLASHPTLREFLSADTHIAIHPTTVLDYVQSLDFEEDVDGVVFELARIQSLPVGIHYLFLL